MILEFSEENFNFFTCRSDISGYILIIGSALYLIIYYVTVFTLRYLETGCLKKTKSSYESSFTQLIKEELKGTDYSQDRSVVKAFAKRYRKKNARLTKKDRKTLTTEEYFNKNSKEVRYAYSIGVLSGILLMFCIGFIESIITGEKMFETPLDVLVYIMINAVIWFLFIKFFKKIEKVSLLEQQSILKACQEQGMELDEYYNTLMKRE